MGSSPPTSASDLGTPPGRTEFDGQPDVQPSQYAHLCARHRLAPLNATRSEQARAAIRRAGSLPPIWTGCLRAGLPGSVQDRADNEAGCIDRLVAARSEVGETQCNPARRVAPNGKIDWLVECKRAAAVGNCNELRPYSSCSSIDNHLEKIEVI